MTSKDKYYIRILVADDEQGMRDFLSFELGLQGYQVTAVSNGEEALQHIQREKFRLVISDLKMPKVGGIDLLVRIKEIDPSVEVIIATAFSTVETAVEAMKKGAYEYVLKPFNIEELSILIERALERSNLQAMVGFYEASRAIFSTIKLNELFEIVMGLIQRVLGADEGSLMLLDKDRKLYIAANRGLSEEFARNTHLAIGERIAGLVAKEKSALLLQNGIENYPGFEGIESNQRIQSSIISPLVSQGELLGVLNISRTHQRKNFTEEDLRVVTVFASQVALAVQNAQLYEKLKNKIIELEEAYQRLEKTQAELVQSEKLGSVGRLISGVAHELNNPLTAVMGYCELAKNSENLTEIQEQLGIISEQADRCVKTVKDLLVFSRQGNPVFRSVDPLKLIEDSLSGIRLELEKRSIRLERNFPAQPVMVLADSHQLKRVFSNILVNAFQALEGISHERVITIAAKVKMKKLEISFSDNGAGIPKENFAKIFDPFFTTKELGRGTGLGLSLSYGIIKEHGGDISIQSELGNGTSLVIQLPITNAPASSENGVKELRSNLSIKSDQKPWKFLLVEDEKYIRTLIEKILDDQHCKLDMASDGETALKKICEDNYDLVLCDFRIPKMNGVMLFEAIKQINPEMSRRFLFISGSIGFIQNAASFFKTNQLICLTKPFTKDELINAIDSVLTGEKFKEAGGNGHGHNC